MAVQVGAVGARELGRLSLRMGSLNAAGLAHTCVSVRDMWTKPVATLAMSLGLGWIGSALAPSVSFALPCSSLPNPVYVAGSIAAGPLVKPVAQSLTRDDAVKLTLVWQLKNSCSAVESLARDTMPASCAVGACITGKAQFWTIDPRDLQPGECDLEVKGTKLDLAISDVAPAMCPGLSGTMTTGLLDTLGPISAYGIVMSAKAGESAIQAEEAHFVFGAGKSAGVLPWQNDSVITLLGDNNAGQLLTGQQIKLPPGRWKGVSAATADDVMSTVSGDPASGIGILPTTLTDPVRAQVKVLAFQAIKQHGAFYPDRKATTFEKQNVRDGHYPLWGYMHLLQRPDPVNPAKPLSPNGARVAGILQGATPVAGKDPVVLQVQAGFIPQCAMKVARTSDSAPLAPVAITESCNCWFEKNVQSGTLGCTPCADGKTCASGKCRRYLCEGEEKK